MKIAVLTIGLPASGKSTFLKAWAEALEVPYISSDAIRAELYEETDQTHNAEVFAEVYRRIHEALDVGSVMVDVTNANGDRRRELVAWCREKDAKIFGLFFDVPVMECFRRNQLRERKVPFAAIWMMNEKLTEDPPKLAEGFDYLHRFH